MGTKTIIAWTHHTMNFWHGCMKVSPGCQHCYAMTQSKRYGRDIWGPGKPRLILSKSHNKKPFEWNEEAKAEGIQRRVFCGSMMDWAEDHPTAEELRPLMWDTIRSTPWLDWQMLTKRSERVKDLLPPFWDEIKGHVWLGVSVENEDYVWRIDGIRDIDAAVRFVSYEPALGPIAHAVDLTNVDWVIYGGESGPGHRPEDKQWARDIMALCREHDTAFFHKQSAAHRTEIGIELDGVIVREYPAPNRQLVAGVGHGA